MPFKRFVEVGRVVFIAFGPHAGKICTIVDIIDQNSALVDGPCSKVKRHPVPFRRLHLTKFVLPIKNTDKTKTIRKAWTNAKINEQWKESSWAKRLKAKKRRHQLTDFDRYKLMLTKQLRRKMIDKQVAIVKRQMKMAANRAKKVAKLIKAGKTPPPAPKPRPPKFKKVKTLPPKSKKLPKRFRKSKPKKPKESTETPVVAAETQ